MVPSDSPNLSSIRVPFYGDERWGSEMLCTLCHLAQNIKQSQEQWPSRSPAIISEQQSHAWVLNGVTWCSMWGWCWFGSWYGGSMVHTGEPPHHAKWGLAPSCWDLTATSCRPSTVWTCLLHAQEGPIYTCCHGVTVSSSQFYYQTCPFVDVNLNHHPISSSSQAENIEPCNFLLPH